MRFPDLIPEETGSFLLDISTTNNFLLKKKYMTGKPEKNAITGKNFVEKEPRLGFQKSKTPLDGVRHCKI